MFNFCSHLPPPGYAGYPQMYGYGDFVSITSNFSWPMKLLINV